LQHALTYDEVMLLSIAPACDVFLLQAVFLAHGNAYLGARVFKARMLAFKPVLPMRDTRPDIKDTLNLQLIESNEGEYEVTERNVIVGAHDARLGVLVKPLIVRVVETPEPIHGAEVYPKACGTVAKRAVA
jgi:hypothetical protein